MSKQVTVGLWAISYPNDDVVRVLIGGMKNETVLVPIDVTNVEDILAKLGGDSATVTVTGVPMKPQEIIEEEDYYDEEWDEPFERFNYNLHDENLSAFMDGEPELYELAFPEPTDRETFARMIWGDPVIDALMWKVQMV